MKCPPRYSVEIKDGEIRGSPPPYSVSNNPLYPSTPPFHTTHTPRTPSRAYSCPGHATPSSDPYRYSPTTPPMWIPHSLPTYPSSPVSPPLLPSAPVYDIDPDTASRCHGDYDIPGPLHLIKEVPVTDRITAVMFQQEVVYILTDRDDETVTLYDIAKGTLSRFGIGSGGLLYDPHPGRDCLCVANGGTVTRVSKNGNTCHRLNGKRFLPIDGNHNFVSMATLGKGNRVKYVAVDDIPRCVIIIDPDYGHIDDKIAKGRDFHPCHVATHPSLPDKLAVTGSNQVRLYSKGRFNKWKPTDIGCHDNGDEGLVDPAGLCIDGEGRIVVCDRGNARVVRYTCTKDDWVCDVIIAPEVFRGRRPSHVDVSADGHVIVAVQSEDGRPHGWLLFGGYNEL